MLRTICASLAVASCFAVGIARPAAPPFLRVPLDRQLEFVRYHLGKYKLAGHGADRFVVELRFSLLLEEDLARLTMFDRLERLDLPSTNLSDVDLAHIVRLRTLRSLDLAGASSITDEGARLLATLPRLESLALNNAFITKKGIADLARPRNLKCLKCMCLDDAGLLALARCRKLEGLEVLSAEITEEGARAFASMPRLKSLVLSLGDIAPKGQPYLGRLVGLKSFDYSGDLTDAGFDAVVRLPALEEFGFRHASKAAVAKVADMKAVKSIGDPGGDLFLAAVSRCKTVERVIANDDSYTDAGVAHLARLPALRILCLSTASVTDAGVAQLAGCPALRELNLSQTKVTDACIPSLVKMKSLRKVDLRDSKVTKEGFEQLRKARPGMEIDIRAFWIGVPNR